MKLARVRERANRDEQAQAWFGNGHDAFDGRPHRECISNAYVCTYVHACVRACVRACMRVTHRAHLRRPPSSPLLARLPSRFFPLFSPRFFPLRRADARVAVSPNVRLFYHTLTWVNSVRSAE